MKGYIIGTLKVTNCVSVWAILLMSRMKTLPTLKSRPRASPRAAASVKPSRAAAIPTRSGRQPRNRQGTSRMTIIGTVCQAATSMRATGNISRGTGSLVMSERFCTSDWVPPLKVSVKKWTITMPANRWMAKFSIPAPRPIITWNRK